MAEEKQLKIVINGDVKDAQSALDSFGTRLGKISPLTIAAGVALERLGEQVLRVGVGFIGESIKAFSQQQDAVAGLTAGLKNTNDAVQTAGHWVEVHTGATKESKKEINNQIEALRLQRREIALSGAGHKDQTHAIDLQILSLQKQKAGIGEVVSTSRVWVEGNHVVKQSVNDIVKSLEDQANALQLTTRFSDEQILSADAMLTTFQLQGDTIKKLNPSILDKTGLS